MPQKHALTPALWSPAPDFKTYPELQGETEVDVAIVGAGITGISAAYLLAAAGKKVAVLEEQQVGMGTTGSSTGNLYAPIDEQLFSLQTKHSTDTLKEVTASRISAMKFIEQRIGEHDINCSFRQVPFYLFTTPETTSRNQDIDEEYRAAITAGLSATQETPANFPFQTDRMLNISGQAQFNPLQYVQGLASSIDRGKCNIYENTRVTDVQDGRPCTVQTEAGSVEAQQVIMATHTPKGIYAVHTAMEPYREFAMAAKLKGTLPEEGIYWHAQTNQHYSVRPVSDGTSNYLLALGQAYKVGHNQNTGENLAEIEEYLRRHFDVESVDYTWAAQNYKPADHLPYIGNSPLQTNVFIATGFAADGLVYGTLAAMIITDLIRNRDNHLAKLYSPTRFTPKASAPKFMKENIHVASHLLKDHLFYGEVGELREIPRGEAKTTKINGERLAAYRDEQGELSVVSSICPHMGCVVHWNSAEKTWDCPCHGSRFSVTGKVLEGPAYGNLAQPRQSLSER